MTIQQETADLWAAAKAGDKAARDELILSNRPLISIAIKQMRCWRGLSWADMESVGSIALITAVDSFDHTRGFRFSTYAVRAIVRDMVVAVSEVGSAGRIPSYIVDLRTRVYGEMRRLSAKLGRRVGWDEGMDAAGIPEGRRDAIRSVTVDRMRGRAKSLASLAASGEGDYASSLAAQSDDDAPEDIKAEWLRAAFAALDAREREVLRLAYGVDDCNPRTSARIAAELGLPVKDVKQIRRDAVSRLKFAADDEFPGDVPDMPEDVAILDGVKMSVGSWARKYGLERTTLGYRLSAGWSMERAISTPFDSSKQHFKKREAS